MLLDLWHCLPRRPPSTFFVMVGAPRSPASPTKGPTIDVFKIGGGRSQISIITSQEPAIYVFKIGCGRSWISVIYNTLILARK
jgi:hypothetical protein